METTPGNNRTTVQKIFISPDESRFRAGWRLLAQTIVMFIFVMCLTFPVGVIALVSKSLAASPFFTLLSSLTQLVAITASVFLVRRFVDKRSITSLGLKIELRALWDVLVGIVITFFMMGFIFIIMKLMGWLTFTGFAWQYDALPVVAGQTLVYFIIFIMVGWQEELLSRGYHLQTITSGINLFWGVVISSAVFGILHLGNPNATWVSAAGIFLAGLFLASAYVWTRQLWLAIGLHIGWNFFEGVVFGFPVSGLDIYPLTRINISGPEIWTGGAFGPEAGLVVIPGLVLGTLLVAAYAKLAHRPKTEPAE